MGCTCHEHGHDHGHHHGCDREHRETADGLFSVLGAGLLLFGGLFLPIGETLRLLLLSAAYLLSGWQVLLEALENIKKGMFFNESFLMSVASFGAFVIGEAGEGAAVMLFYQVGEQLQAYAVGRSRRAITDLMDIRPDTATVFREDAWCLVSSMEVQVGEWILVKAGERIPLDGRVEEGTSLLDTAALTGESLPRPVGPGQEVLSGCINGSGVLKICVTQPFDRSTASRMLEMTEHAWERKGKTEAFISKFARYYTPAVVFSALGMTVLLPLLGLCSFQEAVHRALTFLVISCPCALVLSVPLGYFAGIGCASRNGILVKGGNSLDALCDGRIAVFDKTGTLTQGTFRVTELRPEQGTDPQKLLKLAALAEAHSDHPIARAILEKYDKELDLTSIENADETPGYGMKATVDGREVLAGSAGLLRDRGIAVEEVDDALTTIYVGVDGHYLGAILVEDIVKPEAAKALEQMKHLGIQRTILLTGDREEPAQKAARQVGIDAVYSRLLPQEKAERLEVLFKEKACKDKLLYIGDGLNDAPVLAMADVGIAMGGLGVDAALEAADVVLMDDRLDRLPTALRIARRTRSIVVQNIVFSVAVKLFMLTLSIVGTTTMWAAVFADVGVCLIAVLNALRGLRLPKTQI